jgi:hypothetical protein
MLFFTLLTSAVAQSGTSAGSCYNFGTHKITCDMAECPEGENYYEPGYVSARDNCCHCTASCAEPDEDACTYADVPGSGAGATTTTTDDHAGQADHSREEMTYAADWGENPDSVSEGSCYDMAGTHTVMCDWNEDDCVKGISGVWYKPGHVSSSAHENGEPMQCCHCKPGCPAEGLNDDCEYKLPGAHAHYMAETEDMLDDAPDSGAYAMLAGALFFLN